MMNQSRLTMMLRQSLAVLLAIVVGASCAARAFAVNYTWDASGGTPLDDGSGTWTSTGGTNWFNGTTYGAWGNTTSDAAFFGVGSGTAGTVTVSGSVTTNGLTFNAAGSGNYTLSGGTIGLGGTTPTITVNAAGTTTIGSLLTGVAGMLKSGTGTLSLTGLSSTAASNYAGSTVIGQGTIAITSTGTAALSGDLTLGATAGATDTVNLDLTNGSASFGSLTVRTNSTGTNLITIGSGRTLTTSGNVSLGPNLASTTNLTVAGASAGVGTWVVSSTASGATFGLNMTTTSLGSVVTADLSTLGAFTLNYSAGNSLLRIGSTQNGNVNGSSTLTLAGSSTITVAKIGLLADGSANTGQYTLNLGSGVQQLNTDLLEINRAGRGNATVQFAGATGSVILRAQNGTGRANISMLASNPNTGSVLTSTMNLTGHDADLLVGTLAMTNLTGSPGASYASTFSFDQGKLDVTTLTMAARPSGATGTPSATVNLGSASNLVNTSTIGTITMASNASTAAGISATLNIAGTNTTVTATGAWTVSSVSAASASTATATGAVNISGGTVNANTGIILRSGSGFGTANGTLSLTGGSLVSGGNITSTGSFGAGAATLTLNGGSLDMSGFAIGGSGQTVTTNFQSGTLSNVGEINAGASLAKTTAGTLVLAGSNTYTGTTSVSAGILTLANQNAARNSTLNISTGTVTFSSGVAANAFTVGGLSGTGNITLANNAGSPAAIALSVGNANGSTSYSGTLAAAGSLVKIGTGTLTLQAANTYTGTTTVQQGTLALAAGGAFANSPRIIVGGSGSSGVVLDLTAKTSGFTFGSGQTVSGIGTISMASGQALTLNGTLAPGNSPGTLTIEGGNLVLGGSSITQYEINGTDNTVGGGINDLTRVAGSLTLGGTLNVVATPGFDLFGSRAYRVFDYATGGSGSLAGSMLIGSTPDANYLYSLNTASAGQVNLFVQRRADQSTSFALTPASSRVLVGGSTTLSGILANSSPTGAASLAWNPTVTGSLSGVSSSLGSTIASGSSSTITATFLAGNTAGSQNWSIVNTDNSAITTTSTASGSISVVNQRSFSVSSSGTINLGNFLRTATVTGSTTISSTGLYATTASATLDAFSGTSTNGFSLGLATGTNVFSGGEALQQAIYTLSGSAASVGAINGNFTAGVSAELGSISPVSVALVGTAYDPATAILSGGITSGTTWFINLGEHNQGVGSFTQGFSISNLLQTLGYTADLDLLSFASDPFNTNAIGITLTGSSFGTLAPGLTNSYQASLSLGSAGGFTNVYNLSFGSSKDGSSLGGTPQNVQLTVTGIIVVPEPGAFALAGIGIAATLWALRRRAGLSGRGTNDVVA